MESKTAFIIYMLSVIVGYLAVAYDNHKVMTREFLSAENKVLRKAPYHVVTTQSYVICVSYCHSDWNCRSVNYDIRGQLCELNNTTRAQDPGNFITHYGMVYFDADASTARVAKFTCQDLMQADHGGSGIYTIYPSGNISNPMQVYCDMDTGSGGWTVIQRRVNGSVNFYRNWTDYRDGFGDPAGEFWLGNDNIHLLTESGGTWRLRVELADWENGTAWAEFGDFSITSESDLYTLHVDDFSSDSSARDSLMFHNGMKFSTRDRDNDNSNGSCANWFGGGAWWYKNCHKSNLNGKYYMYNSTVQNEGQGIQWDSWKGNLYSLKGCTMKIIPNS